ncbi:MAG TPA: L-rhamnose mutarotase [Cyclobacteriaceae bacterium]|jgi:L-rhamnose mutarotase|nr:L-rhamnose mutarotase [Cyclobacteriaceae bacterium]
MARLAFKMHLIKGNELEYERRHNELWPELQLLLKNAGIKEYSIFLDEPSGDLFSIMDIEDDKKLSDLPHHAIMKKWWSYMKDIMDTNPDNSPVSFPLKRVFYLP